MQKIVNIVAISSGVVSLAVVGSGLFVYLQRDQLIDSVKSQVLKSVTGSLPGLVYYRRSYRWNSRSRYS